MNVRSYLLLFFVLCGCNTQKHYFEKDYSFFNSNFKPDPVSLLRTDGVYVLQKIWTNADGGTERIATNKQVYKFYNTGQVNLILNTDNRLGTNPDYVQAFNREIMESTAKKSATLFEGYYKSEGNKIVIQRASVPRQIFVYNYGLIEKDTLILVKETITGKGKIKDEYFTDYYKAYYVFVPTQQNYIKPNW